MERRRHTKPDAIWLFDYTSLEAMSDCADKLVWLSERDLNIIWQAVLNIDKFRSRVFLEASGVDYEIVDEDQFSEFKIWVSDMNVNLGSYSMCNEFMQSIAASLEIIANRGCCPSGGTGGSRGSGTSQQPENPYDEAETPEDPPPGFEDMETFLSHKCNMAQDIINELKADLVGLAGIEYSAQPPAGIIGILITILLTPIPYDDLIALVAFLTYTALSYSLLATIAGEMDDDNENAICTLFMSTSVETARADLLAYIHDLADAAFPLPEEVEFVENAVDYMLTNDSLNRLFVEQPTITQSADCSECGDDCTPITSGVTFDFGTVTNLGDGRYSVVAVEASGWACGASAREVAFYRMTSGFRITEFAVTSGTPGRCGTDIYHVFTGLTTPYVGGESSGDVGIAVPQNLGSVYIISNAAFTVEFRLCEIPA